RLLLAGQPHLAPDHLRGGARSSGAVHAQDDGTDRAVLSGILQRLGHGVGAGEPAPQRAALAAARNDVAHHVHERDLRTAVEAESAAAFHVSARRQPARALETGVELVLVDQLVHEPGPYRPGPIRRAGMDGGPAVL